LERIREAILAIRISLEHQGKLHEIRLADPSESGTYTYHLSLQNETETIEKKIDLLSRIGNRFILSIDHRIYDLIIDSSGSEFTVGWNHRFSQIQLTEGVPKAKTAARNESFGSSIVKAQMPGKVVSVLKSTGDEVSTDQGILIIEAMKMQNEMRAPRGGTLVACPVHENDNVNTGDTLFEIG
jgi:biotin carboxyl carrier protein